MTVIEQRTMDAVQAINRKMKDQTSVDWEQRRYEIAKDILPYCCQTSKDILLSGGALENDGDTFPQKVANQAVMFADELIKELKKDGKES